MASGPNLSSPSPLVGAATCTLSPNPNNLETRWASATSEGGTDGGGAPGPWVAQAQDKVNRRESKMGLRSILSRSRIIKQVDSPTSPRRAKDLSESRTLESEADPSALYSSPYSKTVALGAQPLAVTDEDSPISSSLESDKPTVTRLEIKGTKGDLSPIEAPPLYKAYPQAVRYATLPAPVASADSLIRAQEKRGNGETVTILTEQPQGKLGLRRKHRRSKSGPSSGEWCRNVYILTISGWLLEYSGEGPFDRLPQKMVRLGKTSAVFASDLIPGRHWVLHVSCSMGSDGVAVATPDPGRSFLSRLPFRGPHPLEKRITSNMLLVCESAGRMDEWLASLRGAIQALGGRKSLSETGKPQPDTQVQLRGQASQRTLVNRDSARYSARYSHNSGHSELPWEHHLGRRGSDVPFPMLDALQDQSMDEMSATNSFISHDGQQLDSLRNSQNRLSYVSSGQRTMRTSTGSSPGCSPTVDTFPSQLEEPLGRHLDVHHGEVRLRPNSAAILDRRKSLQSPSPLGEGEMGQRPRSTYSGAFIMLDPASPSSQAPAPNFSVPANRRYSSNRMSLVEGASLPSFIEEVDFTGRSGARRPPTALKISRPLSMVADQPSPKEGIPDRPMTGHGEYRSGTSSSSRSQSPTAPTETEAGAAQNAPKNNSNNDTSANQKPRRLASQGTLHQRQGDTLAKAAALPDLTVRSQFLQTQPRTAVPERRYSSAMGRYGRSDSFGSLPSRGGVKRSSMVPYVSDGLGQGQFLEAVDLQSLPLPAPPPTAPLPPLPLSSSVDQLKPNAKMQQALWTRRSMPQLIEGAPLAPPPSCALPPLPKVLSQRS